MPRPRKYHSKEERRLANCAKSTRHYQRNKNDICDRKRASYRSRCERERAEGDRRRKERKEKRKFNEERQHLKFYQLPVNSHQYGTPEWARWRICQMHKNIQRRVNGSPRTYFANLYRKCEDAMATGSINIENEILGDEVHAFGTGFTSIERTAISIKEQLGEGVESAEAKKLVADARCLLLCADDLWCAARQGVNKLLELHSQHELMYQYEEFSGFFG